MRILILHKRVVVLIAMCAVLISGCAVPIRNVYTPQDFKTSKASIGLVFLSTRDHDKRHGAYYDLGGGSLLAIATNRIIADSITQRLKIEHIEPLVQRFYLHAFSDALSLAGFQVKTVDSGYDHKQLKKLSRDQRTRAGRLYLNFTFHSSSYDFTPIFEEVDTDYLAVLEIYRFGVVRHYIYFSPTGPPRGWTALRCSIIERKSNKVVARHFSQNTVDAEGLWDDPPEYASLMKAVSTSFERSLDIVFRALFHEIL